METNASSVLHRAKLALAQITAHLATQQIIYSMELVQFYVLMALIVIQHLKLA